ncbi:MAG: hypothetical protein F7B60_00395 [Desulfurococcales archaeon]|nr:hypothetical protein [Desulfurococcales archaeon]
MKRRTRYDIIADIIKALNIKGELQISKLALEVNLPIDRAKTVLNQLVRAELVQHDLHKRSYELTPKAVKWLTIYRQLLKILKPVEFESCTGNEKI